MAETRFQKLQRQVADTEPAAAPTPVEPEPTWLSVPNEQAWWWHFNGDNYTVPHIFSVMVSNTGTPRYFVQYPDSRWCDEIGGWWLKVEYPNVPTREYMRSSAPAESQGRPAPTQIAAKRYYDRQKEQIAAESQGVERAQPVEGPREPTNSPQGDSGAGGSVPQNLPELIGGPVHPRGAKELSHSQDKTHSRNAEEALKPTPAPCTAPVEGVERVTVAPTVWIVGYTANDKAGILSRGLFFRSIHDSKEAAEKYAAAAFPDSMERPTVTPYFAAQPVERVTDDAPARVEPAIPADIPEFAHDMYRTLKAKDEAKKDRASFWEKELFKYIWVTDGQLLCNPEQISDVIERIFNEGRNSVLYIRCMKHRGGPQYNKDEYGQECTECAVQAAAQPAKHTDDRPADTIPDDLRGDYQRACMQHKGHRGYVQGLIERIGRAEANIARRKDAAMKVTAMYRRLDKHCQEMEEPAPRAETRIEVLEAAIRTLESTFQRKGDSWREHERVARNSGKNSIMDICSGKAAAFYTAYRLVRAALAAPSEEQDDH